MARPAAESEREGDAPILRVCRALNEAFPLEAGGEDRHVARGQVVRGAEGAHADGLLSFEKPKEQASTADGDGGSAPMCERTHWRSALVITPKERRRSSFSS